MRVLTPSTARPLAFLTLASVLATAVAAQRGATTGRVFDADNRPLANASVVFVGARLPAIDAFTDVDRVEVQSDAEGAFTAMLLPHADYCAWAVSPTKRDATPFVSAVRRLVAAGDRVFFTTGLDAPPSTLEIAGFDDWSDHGPLTVLVAPALPSVQPQPIACPEGVGTLPPFAEDWLVFVRDARGLVVHVATASSKRRDMVKVDLPRPLTLRVRTLTPDGEPFAGAELWMHRAFSGPHGAIGTDGIWQRLGTSDAKGELTHVVAHGKHGGRTLVVAGAPHHAPSLLRVDAKPHLDPRARVPVVATDDGTADVPLVMWKGTGKVAHLPPPRTKPGARAVPLYQLRASPGEPGGWRLVAEAAGPWHPDTSATGPVTVLARLPAGMAHIAAIAWLDPEADTQQAVRDLATLRLRTPSAAEGAPARPWRVFLQPASRADDLVPTTTALSLPPGQPLLLSPGAWRLLASDGEHWAQHELDLLPGVTDLPLAAQPLFLEGGRLLPRDGRLPLGVTFHVVDSWFPLLAPAQELAVEWAQSPPRGDGPWPRLVGEAPRRLGHWLAARTRLADDGTFTMRMLRSYEPRLQFVVSLGDEWNALPHFLSPR